MSAVQRSVVLPAPVEKVWAALTDPARLSAWLGGEVAALTDPARLSAWLGGEVELEPFAGGQIAVQEDGRLRRAA